MVEPISSSTPSAPTEPDTSLLSGSHVSPSAFLLFMQRKLHGLDGQIESLQRGMEGEMTEQNRLQGIRRHLEHLSRVGDQINADGLIDSAGGDLIDGQSASAWLAEHEDVARAMGMTPTINADGSETWPNRVTPEQIEGAMTGIDSAVSETKQDLEIRMVEFQNLMQDRSSTVQLVSNCINSMNESTKAVVGNIR